MFKVYSCLTTQHEFGYVLLAALVCMLACGTAVGLMGRVAKARGLKRVALVGTTATVTGAGVWATHFVAMLAFKTGLPTAYVVVDTLASLLVAIALFGGAFHIALRPGRHSAASRSARAGAGSSGTSPVRRIRRRSVSVSRRVMPEPGSPPATPPVAAHGPQARDTAGSPRARRSWASASRKVFAAA